MRTLNIRSRSTGQTYSVSIPSGWSRDDATQYAQEFMARQKTALPKTMEDIKDVGRMFTAPKDTMGLAVKGEISPATAVLMNLPGTGALYRAARTLWSGVNIPFSAVGDVAQQASERVLGVGGIPFIPGKPKVGTAAELAAPFGGTLFRGVRRGAESAVPVVNRLLKRAGGSTAKAAAPGGPMSDELLNIIKGAESKPTESVPAATTPPKSATPAIPSEQAAASPGRTTSPAAVARLSPTALRVREHVAGLPMTNRIPFDVRRTHAEEGERAVKAVMQANTPEEAAQILGVPQMPNRAEWGVYLNQLNKILRGVGKKPLDPATHTPKFLQVKTRAAS